MGVVFRTVNIPEGFEGTDGFDCLSRGPLTGAKFEGQLFSAPGNSTM